MYSVLLAAKSLNTYHKTEVSLTETLLTFVILDEELEPEHDLLAELSPEAVTTRTHCR